MVKLSTAVVNALMGTGSLRSVINGGFLKLFSGPVPATADAATVGGNTLIATFTESDDGTTGLTFESSVSSGVLTKTVAEAWESTAAATGVVTFYRWVEGADAGTGVAGGSDHRVQGTVGSDNLFYDLVMANTSVSATDTLSFDSFQLRQTQAAA